MNPPFLGLRALLVTLFGDAPIARFVDPVLGDVHAEHDAAPDAPARRQVRLRGALLLLRVLPSVVARTTATSFASLTLPLVSLASLGILAIAREGEAAPFARLQALWLFVAVVGAAFFTWLARARSRRVVASCLGVAALLALVSAVPAITRAQGAHLYASVGMSVEPLSLVWPFLIVGLVARERALRSIARGLVFVVASVATARGALGDAVFAWAALAVILSERTRLAALLAPAGVALALWRHGGSVTIAELEPHTDGILQTIRAQGGLFGGLLCAGFVVWSIASLLRGSEAHARIARMLGVAFAGSVAVSAVATLGGLPSMTGAVAGLSYGGSALFMLLGAAGAVAGANVAAAKQEPA